MKAVQPCECTTAIVYANGWRVCKQIMSVKLCFQKDFIAEQTPQCGAGWCGDSRCRDAAGSPVVGSSDHGTCRPLSAARLRVAWPGHVSPWTVKPRRTPSPGYIRVEDLLTSGHAGSGDGHRTAQCPSCSPEQQLLSTVGRPLLAIESTHDLDCCHSRCSHFHFIPQQLGCSSHLLPPSRCPATGERGRERRPHTHWRPYRGGGKWGPSAPLAWGSNSDRGWGLWVSMASLSQSAEQPLQ